MKKINWLKGLLIVGALFFSTFASAISPEKRTDTIKVITTSSLSPLVEKWIDGYVKINPDASFVLKTTDKESQSVGTALLITGDELTAETKWKVALAHDAVVPVVNSSNSSLNELRAKGITLKALGSVIESSGSMKWSEIVSETSSKPIHVYISEDAARGNCLSLTARPSGNLINEKILNREEFFKALKNDMNGFGFCSISELYSGTGNSLPSGFAIVPVDRNGNGKIDNFEMIYDSPVTLLRGVWTGKYPHSLCSSIWAASGERPSDKAVVNFLSWIISEGDKMVASAGFSQLLSPEKESGLITLAVVKPSPEVERSSSFSWPFALLLLVAAGAAIALLLRTLRRKSPQTDRIITATIPVFNEGVVSAPGGLYFDKSHTWAFMERDGLVRIGVDDFLQHVTGMLTEIKMKETGEFVKRGEIIMTIVKDGKQLNLYAPVTGTIRSLNTDLYLDSTLVNSSPYNDGWIYLVEPRNWAKEIQMMLPYERFREWITNEFIRLKDFIAASLKSHYPEFAPVVLQDGGEISDNPLEELGPEIWEDFQTNFIDKSR